MSKAYIFVKGGYEGCSFGNTVYLSRTIAEEELEKEQENPNSEYYNHPMDDFTWYVDELDLNNNMNLYNWYSVKEKPFPETQGWYKCTLNDGNVHEIYCGHYANGWFWEFSRELKINFETNGLEEPKVIAWFPNPTPYTN